MTAAAVNPAFAAKLGRRRAAKPEARDDVTAGGPSGSRPCVLVVDDEPEITASVAGLLERTCDVLRASTSDEALALLEGNSVAVVLTDQRMPGGSGSELLSRVLRVAPEVTRVLFTGYSDITAVIDAVNEGQVYRYVTKPWRPDELQAVVEQGIERYRLVTENQRLLDELTRANEELERRVEDRTRKLREQNEALRRARERIEQLSRHDPLTGLVNRRWLDEVLARELARCERYGAPLSVILADLDHFKAVNDTYGHTVGDQVLQSAAEAMREAVRMTDVVGRYGGEEFLVVLPNTRGEQALVLAERLRDALRAMPVSFRAEPVTGSFGVAEWVEGDTAVGLVERADDALYEAKRQGRDRVVAGSVASERQMQAGDRHEGEADG